MNNQPRFRAEPDSLSQDIWAVMEYLEQDDATVIYSDLSKREAVIAASLLNTNPALTEEQVRLLLSGEISKEEGGRLLSATPAEPAPVDWLEEAVTCHRINVDFGPGVNAATTQNAASSPSPRSCASSPPACLPSPMDRSHSTSSTNPAIVTSPKRKTAATCRRSRLSGHFTHHPFPGEELHR